MPENQTINNYLIRKASLEDIPFIAKTIIEAEKSGTQTIGLAKLFDITEAELNNYLLQILEIETHGCEFSLSSFFVAKYDGEPIAASGGWLEGFYYKGMPSAVIKANLLSCVLPKENLEKSIAKNEIFKDILIPRAMNTYQLEYAFVEENHRGNKLVQQLMLKHVTYIKTLNADVKYIQRRVFANNVSAIKAYQKVGYKIIQQKVSLHPEIMNYLPYHTKLLMEKEL